MSFNTSLQIKTNVSIRQGCFGRLGRGLGGYCWRTCGQVFGTFVGHFWRDVERFVDSFRLLEVTTDEKTLKTKQTY